MYIPVILGTARQERQSEKVARYVADQLGQQSGVEVEVIDPRDYVKAETVPSWVEDERFASWREKATKADAYVIVSPEYNHSFPGELKLLLDGAYDEYYGKSVALIGVSAGGLGGSRVVEHLKPVVNALGMHATKGAVYFSGAKELFDESGNIADKDYAEKLTKLFDELLDK